MELKIPNFHLTPASAWARFWSILRSAAVSAFRNNCLGIAKGAAYSALLAFFPVITTLATLLVTARADEVSRTIAGLLYEVVPPGTEDVVRTLFVVHGERPKWLLVFATLLAIWAASGVMISLMEGFRAVYHLHDSRSLLKERGIAMLLVLTSALPVLGASALIVFGARTEGDVMYWLSGDNVKGWIFLAGRALRYGIAFGAFVVVMVLIYYIGPNRKQRFSAVVPGAILATFLWLLTTLAFGWYVSNVANYNVLYGSVGAGLALLVWMYVLTVIALLGCEYNAARERMSDSATPQL
jgi:membrane protein